MALVDPTDGLFHCEVCSGILEQNDNAENVQGSQEVLTRLREQSQPIIALLKLTDNIVIPARYVMLNRLRAHSLTIFFFTIAIYSSHPVLERALMAVQEVCG